MAWLRGCFLHYLAAAFFFLYWSFEEANVKVHTQRQEVMFHFHKNELNNKLLRQILHPLTNLYSHLYIYK